MKTFKSELYFNIGIILFSILLLFLIKVLRIGNTNTEFLILSNTIIYGHIIGYLLYLLKNNEKSIYYYILTLFITLGIIISIVYYLINY